MKKWKLSKQAHPCKDSLFYNYESSLSNIFNLSIYIFIRRSLTYGQFGPRILRNPDNGKKKFVVKTKACEMEIPWSISFYGGLNCLLF